MSYDNATGIGGSGLKEMVDAPRIQPMMDDMYRLTGMSAAVIDVQGNVLVASGWQGICTDFHRKHPETNKNCIESDTELSMGIEKGAFKLYKCKNNLCDMATPIMVDGVLVGNVFCGQFFLADDAPDCECFRAQAKRYGFDEDKYIEAFKQVPFFDKEKIEDIMRYYSKFANMIAEQGSFIRRQRQMLEEKQKMLQELRSAQQRLIDHERHHALTTMANGIAHDFNNALAVIQGYSDLLLRHPDMLGDETEARKYIEHIQLASQKAAATVRFMRKFYQPSDVGAQRPIDLNRVVEEAIAMSRPRWQEQARAENAEIEIAMRLEDTPLILGNEAELHELMTNLIFNAVDAMPRGGTLSVKTFLEADNICLKVADSGVGMSDEVKKHCFNPFYSAGKKHGSGLGLSIAQGVVKRHKGDIVVVSEEGRGTMLKIRFPAMLAETVNSEPTDDEAAVDPDKNVQSALKLLVVEDDPVQAKLLQRILALEHYLVDIASDGVAALAKAGDVSYDMVITDRAMPGMSGNELAREIRRKHPKIPIIMLTGFGDIMTAASEEAEFVDKLMSKPYKCDELCRQIKALLK